MNWVNVDEVKIGSMVTSQFGTGEVIKRLKKGIKVRYPTCCKIHAGQIVMNPAIMDGRTTDLEGIGMNDRRIMTEDPEHQESAFQPVDTGSAKIKPLKRLHVPMQLPGKVTDDVTLGPGNPSDDSDMELSQKSHVFQPLKVSKIIENPYNLTTDEVQVGSEIEYKGFTGVVSSIRTFLDPRTDTFNKDINTLAVIFDNIPGNLTIWDVCVEYGLREANTGWNIPEEDLPRSALIMEDSLRDVKVLGGYFKLAGES